MFDNLIRKLAAVELARKYPNARIIFSGGDASLFENGKTEVPSVLFTSTPVVKENINETVIAENFVSPTELCEGAFAAACKEAGIKG